MSLEIVLQKEVSDVGDWRFFVSYSFESPIGIIILTDDQKMAVLFFKMATIFLNFTNLKIVMRIVLGFGLLWTPYSCIQYTLYISLVLYLISTDMQRRFLFSCCVLNVLI